MHESYRALFADTELEAKTDILNLTETDLEERVRRFNEWVGMEKPRSSNHSENADTQYYSVVIQIPAAKVL